MRYVTMDETWIHQYTPESNRQSAEWTAKSENRPKRPKTQSSSGKVLASNFGMRSVFYLLITLRKEEPLIANIICFFTKIMNRVISRSPIDYYLFASLKRMFQGKRFGSNEEVIAETEAYFEAKNKSFYKKGIEMLVC